MSASIILRSVALFLVAGLLEIGGGYLVWLWWRDGKAVAVGALGGLVLFLYGIVPTLAVVTLPFFLLLYGGVFVVLSLLWGWLVDRHRPDQPDMWGAFLCVAGVAVIMYWPRG